MEMVTAPDSVNELAENEPVSPPTTETVPTLTLPTVTGIDSPDPFWGPADRVMVVAPLSGTTTEPLATVVPRMARLPLNV